MYSWPSTSTSREPSAWAIRNGNGSTSSTDRVESCRHDRAGTLEQLARLRPALRVAITRPFEPLGTIVKHHRILVEFDPRTRAPPLHSEAVATLGSRVAGRDRELFVARTDELAFFDRVLAGVSPVRIVHVHGPGGIGKSALLREVSRRARSCGYDSVWLDGRDCRPSRPRSRRRWRP
jgi:hypothetical protein